MFPKPVKQENTLFPRTFSHRVQDVKKNASLVEGPKKNYYTNYKEGGGVSDL